MNHLTLSKKLYNGIEKLKHGTKRTKHHFGAKRKVTKKIQKQLSISYSQALKEGAPGVKDGIIGVSKFIP